MNIKPKVRLYIPRQKFHLHTPLTVKTKNAGPYHSVVEMDLMYQEITFRSRTDGHTYTHSHFLLFLYNVCDSPNRQNARHLTMPPFLGLCELFLNTR
jgi:hypothetical protein